MSDEGYQYAAEVQRASNSSYRQMKAEAEALQARITALEAQLKSVLDRESATYVRHDAKLDKLEAQVAAADRLAAATSSIIADQPVTDAEFEDFLAYTAAALAAYRAAKG